MTRPTSRWDYTTTSQFGLAAYPTLFADKLTVEVSSPAATRAEVQLVDVVGRVLLRQPAPLVKGLQQFALQGTAQLPGGTYLLRLTVAGQTRMVRVVKE